MKKTYTTAQLKRLKDKAGIWIGEVGIAAVALQCDGQYFHSTKFLLCGKNLFDSGDIDCVTEKATWRRVWRQP